MAKPLLFPLPPHLGGERNSASGSSGRGQLSLEELAMFLSDPWPLVPIRLPKVALQEDEALQRVKHPGTHPAPWAAQDFRSRGRSMSQSLVTHTGVLARHTLSSCLAPRRVTPRPVWRSPLTSCSCTGPAPTPHAGYCHLPPGQPLPSSSSSSAFSSLFSSSAARAGHGLGPSRGAGGEQARQRAP